MNFYTLEVESFVAITTRSHAIVKINQLASCAIATAAHAPAKVISPTPRNRDTLHAIMMHRVAPEKSATSNYNSNAPKYLLDPRILIQTYSQVQKYYTTYLRPQRAKHSSFTQI